MPDAIEFEPVMGAESGSRDADRLIADLAGGQHGLVGRAQLLAAGIGRRAIGHRIEQGRLHVLHRGVYLVGVPVASREGRWLGAVLAGWPRAALSHRDGAALWQVRQDARRSIEVTVPSGRVGRPGIQFHRARLLPDEVTVHHGIPVTTVARTLLDLGSVLDVRQVERAINESEKLRLWDRTSLAALLHRYPRRAGTATVNEALAMRGEHGPTLTKSDLEEAGLAIVTRLSLPGPEVNAVIEAAGRTFEIDLLWRRQRLAVELDSRSIHATVASFESDRAKDRALTIAGWRPVRFTALQLDLLERELPRLLGTV